MSQKIKNVVPAANAEIFNVFKIDSEAIKAGHAPEWVTEVIDFDNIFTSPANMVIVKIGSRLAQEGDYLLLSEDHKISVVANDKLFDQYDVANDGDDVFKVQHKTPEEEYTAWEISLDDFKNGNVPEFFNSYFGGAEVVSAIQKGKTLIGEGDYLLRLVDEKPKLKLVKKATYEKNFVENLS